MKLFYNTKGIAKMTKKKRCWPSNQTLLLMVSIAFSLLIGVTMADDSSLPNEETFVFESVKSDENLDDFCSQESCQELRWRVETLEEAVRIIVSSLLEQKNPHFANTISRKIGKNPAVRSVLTIPPLPTAHEEEAENTQKEVNHQSQTGRASDDTILNSTDSIKGKTATYIIILTAVYFVINAVIVFIAILYM